MSARGVDVVKLAYDVFFAGALTLHGADHEFDKSRPHCEGNSCRVSIPVGNVRYPDSALSNALVLSASRGESEVLRGHLLPTVKCPHRGSIKLRD